MEKYDVVAPVPSMFRPFWNLKIFVEYDGDKKTDHLNYLRVKIWFFSWFCGKIRGCSTSAINVLTLRNLKVVEHDGHRKTDHLNYFWIKNRFYSWLCGKVRGSSTSAINVLPLRNLKIVVEYNGHKRERYDSPKSQFQVPSSLTTPYSFVGIVIPWVVLL